MCPCYEDNFPVFAYFMATLWIRIHILSFGIDYEVIVSSVARFPLSLQVGLPVPIQGCIICWQNWSQRAIRISVFNWKGHAE